MANQDWESRGKSISQLIKELQSFENPDMEVRISINGGEASVPISLVTRYKGKFAVLQNCEETLTIQVHVE